MVTYHFAAGERQDLALAANNPWPMFGEHVLSEVLRHARDREAAEHGEAMRKKAVSDTFENSSDFSPVYDADWRCVGSRGVLS